ncbi:hypothetical protein B0H14DRAFT_3093767 [Mycena olivaceomarginata]|nr:hypothetical protein B0H14DRAFT_3093767 [Mycena olivaceomarginata]
MKKQNLFQEYQIQASTRSLLFRRWRLKKARSSDTVPFKEAPSAVIGARHLIEPRVAAALGKAHSFNELLSVAYLEAQSMAFHSDNEKGLGPVVAGLSLGSPAVMAFRPTAKPKKGQHRAELCLVLHHGDILVMEGTGIQHYYQSEPKNFRIAVTARHIGLAGRPSP